MKTMSQESFNPLRLSMVIAVLLAALIPLSLSQTTRLGPFEAQSDIGKLSKPGSGSYDLQTQEYAISGSGANMWLNEDQFHFVWKRMKGNFILSTRARFIGNGVENHRKIGWIIRASLEPDSSHVNAAVHGDGLTSLQFRKAKRAETEELRLPIKAADVIQLERMGDTYRMSAARFGEPFVTEQVSGIGLGDEVYVGLYVCSHNDAVVEKAVFRDVRITVPAKDDFIPYRDYLGSNLEILVIDNGYRTILRTSPDSLQAPNWTPDSKALIYNSNGRLYRFDLAQKKAAILDTATATSNNNDHVLSFDGKMIGISNHSKEDQGKSIVYTLPIKGGLPRRITAKGPSYLHGWSPDGKFLVYTGERNGEFDIYKISSDGGEEIRLTSAKGLDDGSEFSPDGKYIYFNSVRTGTMQLWRMKPDGSDQEQITSDEYNNWFPHVSPNGKLIVFLSFLKEVDPSDHPFYKQVYLRLMPASGGQAKVIAYLYGGQGTINVPSWSPDSARIAFISNTDVKSVNTAR